jgi:hypothetical protein
MKPGQKQQLKEVSLALAKFKTLEVEGHVNLGLEFQYTPHPVTVLVKPIPNSKKMIFICPSSLLDTLRSSNATLDMGYIQTMAASYGLKISEDGSPFEDSNRGLLHRLAAVISFSLGVFGLAEFYNAVLRSVKDANV